VVLNGGTARLPEELEERLGSILQDGLARVVAEEDLTAVTGGTDAGVFALFGRGVGDDPGAVCVGVAPVGAVRWPGRADEANDPDRVPLEPHHSHFVLVEGEEWGDELEAMLGVASALGAGGRSLAVLVGGGTLARRETLGHARAGRDVLVVAGSGRCADELASVIAAGAEPPDADFAEIRDSGRVRVFPADAGAEEFADLLRSRLLGKGGP
jgi:hypothetical protein